MRRHALLLFLTLALPLATLTCVGDESSTGVVPGDGPPLQLIPRLSSASSASAAAVDRIRLVARDVATDEILGASDTPVDPSAPEWDVSLELDLPEDGSAEVIVDVTLLAAGEVEWSGRAGPLLVEAGSPTTVEDVDVFRGPLDNLSVTEVSVADPGVSPTEGEPLDLQAAIETSDPSAVPRIFWTSLDPEIATVSDAGRVSALLPGTARIVAEAGPRADTFQVVVRPRPTELAVEPGTLVLTSLLSEGSLTARVLDPRGDPIDGAGARVTWEVADPVVAEHLGGGTFRSLENGETVVSATFDDDPTLADEAGVAVAQEVAEVAVRPDSLHFAAVGARARLAVDALDANGHPVDSVEVDWSVFDGAVAGVDPDGLVTSRAPGATTVDAAVHSLFPTATASGGAPGTSSGTAADTVEGSAKVVVEQVVDSVDVTPATTVLLLLGADTAFTATAFDASGSPVPDVRTTWSSSNPAVATVDTAGRATAADIGRTWIRASVGAPTDSALLDVRVPNLTLAGGEILPDGTAGDTVRTDSIFTRFRIANTGNRTAGSAQLAYRIRDGADRSRILVELRDPQPSIAPDDTLVVERWVTKAEVDPAGTLEIDSLYVSAFTDPGDAVDETTAGDNELFSRRLHILPDSAPAGADPYEENDAVASAWDIDAPTDPLLDAADGTAGIPFRTVNDPGGLGVATIEPGTDQDHFRFSVTSDVALALAQTNITGSDPLRFELVDVQTGEIRLRPTSVSALAGFQVFALANVEGAAGGRGYALRALAPTGTTEPAAYEIDVAPVTIAAHDFVDGDTASSTEPNDFSSFAGANASGAPPFDVVGTLLTPGRSYADVDLYQVLTEPGVDVEVLATNNHTVTSTLDVGLYELDASHQLQKVAGTTVSGLEGTTGSFIGTVSGGSAYVGVFSPNNQIPYDLCVRPVGGPCRTASLAKTAGDGQSGTPGTTLPTSLQVQAQDGFGNPVPGVLVKFGAASGTLGATEVLTDPNGFASVDYTLPNTTGSFDVKAWATGVDTTTFTVFGSATTVTRQWTGSVSGDWSTAGNWSPTGVPATTDTVFVGSAPANQPVLSANASVGGVVVENGATVDLAGFDLTADGDVRAGSTIAGPGTLVMTGTGASVSGTVPSLQVDGTVALAGTTVTTGNVSVTLSSSLDLAGFTLDVGGDFSTGAQSRTDDHLFMTTGGDELIVRGNLTLATETELTAGTVTVLGNVTQTSDGGALQPTGTRFVLAGSAAQTVSFGSPGPTTARFEDVEIQTPDAAGGVTFATDVWVAGRLTVAAGAALHQSSTESTNYLTVMPANAGGVYDVANTVVDGTVTMTASRTLSRANNDVLVTLSSSLDLAGFTLDVGGDFSTQAASRTDDHLFMTTGGDELIVRGNLTLATETELTAGTVTVMGNVTQTSDGGALQPTGTRFVLAGSAAQTVSFGSPGATSARFEDVEIQTADAAGGVTFASDVWVAGRLTVAAGAALHQASTASTHYLTVMPANAGGVYDVVNTVVDGAVTMTASRTLSRASNDVLITLSSSLDLAGFTLDVGGDFSTGAQSRTDDHLFMTTGGDQLIVRGNLTLATETELTAGTVTVMGDLTQTSDGGALDPAGTRFVLAGSAAQTVSFGSPGATSARFEDVEIQTADAAGGVTFASDVWVAGRLTVASGAALHQASTASTHYLTVMPANAGGVYDVVNTVVDGAVTMTASRTLSRASNDVFITLSSSLDLAGFTLDVGGDFSTGAQSRTDDHLFMTTGGDQLIVRGNMTLATETELTAGRVTVYGDFVQSSDAGALQPTGTLFLFASTTGQKISIGSPGFGGGAHFADMTLINGGDLTITGATYVDGRFVSGSTTSAIRTGAVGTDLIVRELQVNGLVSDGVHIIQQTTDPAAPVIFNDVTYQGFTSSDTHIQLSVRHPGNSTGFLLSNVSFVPLDIGNTVGLYVQAEDRAETDANTLELTFDTEPGDGVNTLLGTNGTERVTGTEVVLWP